MCELESQIGMNEKDTCPISINTRIALVSDINKIVELERQAFSNPWSEISVLSWITAGNGAFLIAENAQGILGYIGYHIAFDIAEIDRFAVADSVRRCGIGTGLMNHFMQMIKQENIGRIYLEVRESNEAALHLYEMTGFIKVGLRKGYYTDTGEAAILMECQI